MAADLTLQDLSFAATALIENMKLSLDIHKANVDKVIVNSDTIGKLSGLTIKVEINNGIRLFLPVINSFFAQHLIPLPQHILGIFALSDAIIEYYDSFIMVGATPTFIPRSEDPMVFV